MEAIEAILTRRSTRLMQQLLPPRELIEKVIEAGRAAPSGGNNQTTHVLVITNRDVLSKLAILVKDAFAGMEDREDLYRSLRNAIRASQNGNYVFHYHAPVLIVTANRKGYSNGLADSACALENMMIAANALDLGSCWINQLHWLDENAEVRAFLEALGLLPEETVTGGLILGYAKDNLPLRTVRAPAGNPVTWIE